MLKKLLFVTALMFLIGCKHNVPEPTIIYIPVEDTLNAVKVVNLTEELRRTRDSLNAYKTDTAMSEELFIARFKLEKIKYYNEIAAKGNNIKFLRGWINRTLEEE